MYIFKDWGYRPVLSFGTERGCLLVNSAEKIKFLHLSSGFQAVCVIQQCHVCSAVSLSPVSD